MRRAFLAGLLAVAFASPEAVAQPCYAENDTPNFNDLVSMGGPNLLLAIRFTPNVSVAIDGAQVFTGEVAGTQTLGIWSHDAAQNQPSANLGTGSWAATLPNSWQGTALPGPVNIVAGQTYWLVWGPQNGAQAAVDVPMATPGQPYRGSFNGGTTWSGPFQFNDRHWKFRLTCACKGFFAAYGAGCPGTNGIPTLTGTGCATPGDTISIQIANGLAGNSGLLLLGAGSGAASIVPGCTIENLPLYPPVVPLFLGLSGGLTITTALPPTTPTPIDLHLQAVFPDPFNPFVGVAATNALQMHIQ